MTRRSIRRHLITMTVLAAAGGVLAGIGGVVHGIGEVRQGSGSPGGIVFDSWATGGIARNLGGEPAMSLVPDLLVSGLLTLGVSVAVALWAARFADHRYGGRGLAALSVLLLLVGGGFGPPVMGLLAALVAGAANRSRHRAPRWAHRRAGEALAAAWPTMFWLCLADYVFLAFGSVVAGVVLDVDISSAFVYALFLAVLAMPVAALAGTAHDAVRSRTVDRRKSQGPAPGTGGGHEADSRRRGVDDHSVAAHREAGAMKALTGLLPLAVVLLVVGALVWWLLDRGSAVGPWLVAAILFAHGWVHLVFLLPSTQRGSAETGADNPFDMDRSWLIERGADSRLVHSVGAVLAVVTFAAFAGAALAVVGWLIPGAWWTGLVFTGVVGSTMLLVLFFAPTLVLGFFINAGLVALAIQTAWEIPR
ncbi:MAG TPA: hypothetical protein VFZ63_11480 [Jiangellaceae bacterium]